MDDFKFFGQSHTTKCILYTLFYILRTIQISVNLSYGIVSQQQCYSKQECFISHISFLLLFYNIFSILNKLNS